MEVKIENLTLLRENPLDNVYELYEEELSIYDLKLLNKNGYVYHSEQLDIDFEDQDDEGNLITCYMNIYYFSKATAEIHNSQLPL